MHAVVSDGALSLENGLLDSKELAFNAASCPDAKELDKMVAAIRRKLIRRLCRLQFHIIYMQILTTTKAIMKKNNGAAAILAALSIILATGTAQAKPQFGVKPPPQGEQAQDQSMLQGGIWPMPPQPIIIYTSTCTVQIGGMPPALQAFADHSMLLYNDQEQLRGRVVTVADFLNTSASRLGMLETIDSDLLKVESALKTIKQGAVSAQAIPQAREKASALEKRVTPALQKVTAAREKMDGIVAKTRPIREKLETAGRAADTAAAAMYAIDTVLYFVPKACLLAGACDSFPGSVTHIGPLVDLAKKIDPDIQEYDRVVKLLLHGTTLPSIDFFGPFDAQLDVGDALREELEKINKELSKLVDQLSGLNRVLDRSLSFSFPYPNPSVRHMRRISHYSVGVSVRTIMNGTKAIEDRIESVLSGYLWRILKNLGLNGYVNDLKNAADNAVNEMLRAVGFDISVDIPDFGLLDSFTAAIPNLKLSVDGISFPDISLSRPDLGLPGIKAGVDITGIDKKIRALFPAGFEYPFKCNPAPCVSDTPH
jgi:hypothetical protein